MKPSQIDILRAVSTAVRPQSVYINNEIQRWHAAQVSKWGMKGHPPSSSFVLHRLRHLVAAGYLIQSQFSDGLYGYTWTITDAGKARLALG
ncbi:hypothetical protein G6M87_11095 [Rhizobium rhizogenes]|uniref:hypothetical protein n=1 Tax=Rhizobium rhizogenes TaxID=359 RepID=UPI001571DEC4|nr:hypothetical protein [Rhizobium rhizogenes]NTI22405.1 hypothetical protein [Rhizobium rhizogenes]QTG05988.1 hypothetical protein G6M87_11095 [Rhizobium rhizogenes]